MKSEEHKMPLPEEVGGRDLRGECFPAVLMKG